MPGGMVKKCSPTYHYSTAITSLIFQLCSGQPSTTSAHTLRMGASICCTSTACTATTQSGVISRLGGRRFRRAVSSCSTISTSGSASLGSGDCGRSYRRNSRPSPSTTRTGLACWASGASCRRLWRGCSPWGSKPKRPPWSDGDSPRAAMPSGAVWKSRCRKPASLRSIQRSRHAPGSCRDAHKVTDGSPHPRSAQRSRQHRELQARAHELELRTRRYTGRTSWSPPGTR